MPIPTRATLKSYFETADVPTQAQFAAFIDAAYDMAQEATDTAAAAEALANAAVATVAANPGAVAAFRIRGGYPYVDQILKACTVVVTVTTTVSVAVTFSAPLADANYVVSVTLSGGNNLNLHPSIEFDAQTASGFTFHYNKNPTVADNPARIDCVVHKV